MARRVPADPSFFSNHPYPQKFSIFTAVILTFMKLRIFLLPVLICGTIYCQNKDNRLKLDSLSIQFKKDSTYIFRRTIAKPYLRLENRRSFLAAEKVNFNGFLAGANLHERHILSAGYYFLDKNSKQPLHLNKEKTATQQFSRLNYGVFSYQYVLLNGRFLQLNTPIEFGYGHYTASVTDSLNQIEREDVSGNFLPLGAGLQLIYKPIRWSGISVSGGYRYVRHDAISLRFNGWYYSFGLWIDARYLYRWLRYSVYKKRYKDKVELISKQANEQ
jgi:hypothetical protein